MHLILGTLRPAQDFKYQYPSNSLVISHLKYKALVVDSKQMFADKYLPKQYSTKGNTDYTQYLQKAIDENDIIVMPNFPILVGKSGISVGSNKTIFFQKKSQIIYTGPANGKFWDILKIYDVNNVTIINPNIKGSRNSTLPQSGEWSAGISILNSKNVTIENPKIYDTYGDGIFIGSENGGYSENVQINNGWIDNVRRNGISITSGKNIFLKNILISNTNGTLPMAGIDIEPSISDDIMVNINLNDIYTFNNENGGIGVNLNALSVKDPKNVKSVSINMNNHKDYLSTYSFGTSLRINKDLFDAKGIINVNNPSWENFKTGLYWKSNTEQTVIINFKNIRTSNLEKKKELEVFLKKQKNVTVQ